MSLKVVRVSKDAKFDEFSGKKIFGWSKVIFSGLMAKNVFFDFPQALFLAKVAFGVSLGNLSKVVKN